MRRIDEYFLACSATVGMSTAAVAFARAWRFDFDQPGFCLLDLGPELDGQTFRAQMLSLKNGLDEAARAQSREPFVYASASRFDQQRTTKFHLDGAPDVSLLMLGYEPSSITSRIWIADYTRCAFDQGLEPKRFLQDFNPMHGRGDKLLSPYATDLPLAAPGHWGILLINNSSLPYAEERSNPLGVMHKAEILNPSDREQRLVDSIMLVAGASAQVSDAALTQFVAGS